MASNDTVCWDKLIPHTVIGKFRHTIAITEGGGKENDKHKHLGDRLQTLAHPMKQFHKIWDFYFWNHTYGRIAKLA